VRVFAFLLVLLLLAAGATYALMNLEERVDIHLPGVILRNQPQSLLVFASLAVGAFVTGLIGLAYGARLRFANRRLRREIHRFRQQGLALLDPREGGAGPGLAPHRRDVALPAKPAGHGAPATHPVIPAPGPERTAEDEPPYGM